jgi:asparagine synthase (glutamine-hydrolysing)
MALLSDCSVIGPLWARFKETPDAFFRALDGVFAIIIVDEHTGLTTIGRDPYGVRPLFYCYQDTAVMVASELKAFDRSAGSPNEGAVIEHVRPGCWMQFKTATGVRTGMAMYHTVPWIKNPALTEASALESIRICLMEAVRKRLMTQRPVAALLSGGVDSSLIAALVQRELKMAGRGPLETYTVGFQGSPDLLHAREVASWIGSYHTEIVVTPDEFFAVIPEVIRDIESYDITTVRASVGNWFVAREIRRRSEAKVIFNGDGADEVFGSYLYFFRSPDDESYEQEVTRLLREIHRYDVLRSDRCISSHGLEPRTPFLDKQFVAAVRSIPTEWLRPRKGVRCEKWVLRAAFADDKLLPESVLWRQKEAFSDGVSGKAKSWYQEIQERIGARVGEWAYTHVPPITPEATYYRDLFHDLYGGEGERVISHFWMPKWSGETKDPSARTLSIYL